ncbi:MAG: DoxX family protein [Thiobacillus sp.]|nr:DoxX family protein [Thiobacillus sp.]
MHAIVRLYSRVSHSLECAGSYLSLLALRLLLGWEFWEAGVSKYTGENWFINIQQDFPFPFNIIPVDISWFLATWFELLGAIALVIGLGTRFFSVSLIILTVIAWASVHAGLGYNVCDNGYKLPLMYLIMLVPLVLSGPGKLSIDYWLARRYTSN